MRKLFKYLKLNEQILVLDVGYSTSEMIYHLVYFVDYQVVEIDPYSQMIFKSFKRGEKN